MNSLPAPVPPVHVRPAEPLSKFVQGLVEVDRELTAKRAASKPASDPLYAPHPDDDTGRWAPFNPDAFAAGFKHFSETQRKAAASAPAPMPTWSWLLTPTHGRGYLVINGTTYQTTEHGFTYENGTGGRLWDLQKSDGTTYRLCCDHDADLACDCPDATYRERPCKHVLALTAAFNELNRIERLNSWLAAIEGPADVVPPLAADCPF